MSAQVSRSSDQATNAQMSVVGYVVAAGIAIVLLPVPPVLLIAYALTELTPDAPDDDPEPDVENAG